MKTTLLLTLLLSAFAATAQDFQAVPPAQRPNAAELTYFGSKHPNAPLNSSDTDNIRLISDFLNELINGQFEAAHEKLSADFRAYSPGFADFLETDNLLAQWDRNGQLFTDQQLTIETAKSVTITEGDRRGQWVFVKAIWSAEDSRQQGLPIRIPFYELARIDNHKIHRTYTSYGSDQLFYDLGFPLYSTGSPSQRNELTQKR